MADEASVGISAFSTPDKGFNGIFKQRYSDFIVREVPYPIDATSSLSLPVRFISDNSVELEKAVFGGSDKPDTNQETALSKIAAFKADLGNINNINIVTSIEAIEIFITNCINREKDCELHISPISCSDKASRTAVHQLFKAYFLHWIESTTDTKDGVSLIKLAAKNSTNQKRNRQEWPDNVGDFLEFTMIKENIDTMAAISVLSKYVNAGPSAFKYAGTKDKRAVTAQKLTLYRKRPTNVARINFSNRFPIIRVGDFKYVKEPLKLGLLSGNRFEITLREVVASDLEVNLQCENVKKNGFINYFGLQRFGRSEIGTHGLGRSLFRGKFKELLDGLFLVAASDTRSDLYNASLHYKRGDYRTALNVLPSSYHTECSVLHALIDSPNDYIAAFSRIPHAIRLMYSHAYQSYLWNMTATERIRMYGLNVVEGDLVANNPNILLEGDDFEEQILADISGLEDNTAAAAAAAGSSSSGGSGADSGAGVGDDSKRARTISNSSSTNNNDSSNSSNNNSSLTNSISSCHIQRQKLAQAADIHVVTLEDVQSNRYSMKDVILPITGSEVKLPTNAAGDYLISLLAQDGLTLNTFTSCLPQYRSYGAYRALLTYAKDFSWTIVPYHHIDDELAETELSSVSMKIETALKAYKAKNSNSNSSSSSSGGGGGGGGNSLTSSDTLQTSPPPPQIGTFDGAAGSDVQSADESMECSSSSIGNSNSNSNSSSGSSSSGGLPKNKKAVHLNFTLNSGTYATMFLREITKCSTETKIQSNMTELSRCDGREMEK